MSFVKRQIDLTFQLGEGDFGTGGSNTVKLSGLRVMAKIIKAGGPSMGTAQLQVYGMALDKMNKLSTLGMRPTTVRKNTIIVEAGDEGGAKAAVFQGNITNAWFDGSGAPEVAFQVLAHVGGFDAVNPVKPTTFKGSVDVATLLSGLATQMGKSFENNGVNVKLSNPYFTGSARDQALAIVKAAGIQWNGLDDNKLAIWPSGQARGGQVPLVSAATGMIGYPNFTSQGIYVQSIFNPSIGFGSKIKVKSTIEPANGEWVTYALNYDLSAEFPQGPWLMSMSAARPGYAVVA
jgi:hypothetical protein